MHWKERPQNREEGRELARGWKDCNFKQGESGLGPLRGGPSCKGLQRVKALVTGASGEACSGRWSGHCKGPEAGDQLFQNSREASVVGPGGRGEKWGLGRRNGARPLRALGRKRKIKNGPWPAEHIGD